MKRRPEPRPSLLRAAGRHRLVRWLAALALLVLLAWATGLAALPPLALARRSLERRDNDEAAKWATLARTLDSTNPDAEFLLGRIERHKGRLDQADAHLKAAESRGLPRETARRERMLAAAEAGQLDGIEEPLNRWLAEAGDADRREICEAYANGLARLGRLDDARRLLDAWRADFPDDPQPDYRAGRILEHLRLKAEAEARYREALAKDPNYIPAAYSLARLLLEHRQVEEALALYRRCAESPRPEAAEVGMGLCLKSLGKIDEARQLFRKAADASEQDRAASYAAVGESSERFLAASELGKLESEAGRFEEAEKWLRLAVESNPRDTSTRYAWAVALRGRGRKDEAERQFELVREARAGLDEAGKLHDRVDQHPDDVEARYRLGVLILKYDSERTGVYWLRTALEHDPCHVPSHRALAEHFASKAAEDPAYRRIADDHRRAAEECEAGTRTGPPTP